VLQWKVWNILYNTFVLESACYNGRFGILVLVFILSEISYEY